MNRFYKYKCNNYWITIREENNEYYTVNPEDLEVLKLSTIQAAMLYAIYIEKRTISDIKEAFSKQGIKIEAVDHFLDMANSKNLIDMSTIH